MTDLVIRNARLVLPEGVITGDVAIENGKIKNISLERVEKGEEEIDAKNRLVIPGVFDTEAHLLRPVRRLGPIIKRETAAASAGGVTTVLVSPEPSHISDAWEAKKTIACLRRCSLIDFSLQAGPLAPESVERMVEVSAVGIRAFKLSTCYPRITSEHILEAMKNAKNLESILCIRAEGEETTRKKSENGRSSDEARPPLAEEKAIETILEMVKQSGAKVHFERVTTSKACDLICGAEKKHLEVFSGTCIHYLVFSKADFEKDRRLKLHPPLRSEEDLKSLWTAVTNGTIDVVSSGHFSVSIEELERLGPGDAPAGLPGIEVLLPAMFELGVRRGRMTVEMMAKTLSTKPAQIFGLYPRKGVLREGSDADLVILDSARRKVESDKLFQLAEWTPYEGMELSGFPAVTISRGEVIYEDGEIVGKAGRGLFLTAP